MAQYDYIRFLYFNEGMTQRAIAKQMKIHRNTVKRAIENSSNGYKLTVEKVQPVNGEFKEMVEQMVRENTFKPRKHKLTKKRMYELIQEEGYPGSYSAFTYLIRTIEKELNISAPEAFLKLSQNPGTLQVDFGEMVVLKDNIPKKVIVFCAKLSNSKVEFIKAYPRQSTEFFLDCLNSTFEFLGGVPRKIMFDNLKQAVKYIDKDGKRILQNNFISFKAFYAFEAVFCGPRKGNEKGLVENLVKFVRNNYFLPYIKFTGFDKLNEHLMKLCLKRLNTSKKDNKYWSELLDSEKREGFLDLRDIYDPSVIIDVKVDSYQLIHVDSNRYSVPTAFVGQKIQVKLYPFKIVCAKNDEVLATHPRLFGKGKEILNPHHYLDLLRRKTKAYDDAKFIKDWNLPDIFEEYHRQLKSCRASKSKGTREFIDILRLTEKYGVKYIERLLKRFHKENHYSYEEILSYIRNDKESSSTPKALKYDVLSDKSLYNIKSDNMPIEAYSELLIMEGK